MWVPFDIFVEQKCRRRRRRKKREEQLHRDLEEGRQVDSSWKRKQNIRRGSPLTLCISDTNDNPVTKSNTNSLHLSTYNKEGTLVSKFSKTELQQCPYGPIQSYVGLICIGPMDYGYNSPILLCNPSTEELIALPPTQGYHHCIGFGYVASTKVFKVVRFFIRCGGFSHYMEDCCYEVVILGASEWREARNPPPLRFQFEWGAPFLQGGLHLLNIGVQHDFIYVFDIDNEECKTIPFPDFYHREEVLAHYGVIRLYSKEFEGSLYLIFDFTTSLELWCLKDYENREWAKEYTIDLNPLGSDVSAEPIAIMGDGCVLFSIESKEDGASLYCYSSVDKSFSPKMEAEGSATLYVESFLSLESRP